MQFFRTLCVIAVLGALSYGAYVTLTGRPPAEPSFTVANWDSPPRIELPGAAAPSKPNALPPTFGGTTAATPQPSESMSGVPKPPPTGGAGGAARLGTPSERGGGAPLGRPMNDAKPSSFTAAGSGTSPYGTAPSATTAALPANSIPPYPTTNIPPGPFDGNGAVRLAGGATSAAAPAGAINTAGASSSNPPGTSLSTVTDPAAASAAAQPSASTATSGDTEPFAQVQPLLTGNQLPQALELLSRSFDDPRLSAEQDRRVMELLDQLAGSVIYSREHTMEPPYVVQPGDGLDQIAARYQVPWELLAKVNGISDPANLAPGTQLKVVRGPFNALVDKSRRRLSLFVDGLYAGSFPVGFGQDAPVVDGQYVVGAIVPLHAGNAQRRIELGNGVTIHASFDEASLGDDRGRGCIRLAPNDAAEVHEILTAGSQVIVRP